jgi:small basic protein (TIGR04137 family)
MLPRRAWPAAQQAPAHPFPIYEMGSSASAPRGLLFARSVESRKKPLAGGPGRGIWCARSGLKRTNSFMAGFRIMSQHRSLRAAATLGGKRNVLKRFERTELLKKRGQWKEGDRITGLRKTKPET